MLLPTFFLAMTSPALAFVQHATLASLPDVVLLWSLIQNTVGEWWSNAFRITQLVMLCKGCGAGVTVGYRLYGCPMSPDRSWFLRGGQGVERLSLVRRRKDGAEGRDGHGAR